MKKIIKKYSQAQAWHDIIKCGADLIGELLYSRHTDTWTVNFGWLSMTVRKSMHKVYRATCLHAPKTSNKLISVAVIVNTSTATLLHDKYCTK